MSEKEKFYITTPIYYPSGKWHIGTCYTTIVCDAIARFKRMQGYDVFYLTGTDEHGQKIQDLAKENNVTPKAYVDNIVGDLQNLWKLLDISYDKFIRTTDEYHEKAVQKIFQRLYDQGDIYKGEYEGYYFKPCESFWTKTQLVDGKCPDCGREVEITHEEDYFLRLSKYQDKLIKLLEDNPEFLEPKTRQNEMINNFLKPGLQDLCVSRTSFDWGIKVPFDPKHVIYVWIDALTNYITALGYGSDDTTLFDKYWPADIHMVGKEIVRFHSIIWPAMLMMLDLPLPKKIYGHGWLKFGEEKMSKSKGNVVDPYILCDRYGVDALRYYMLREVSFGQDGNYTNESFLKRVNTDLTNELSNLVSRVAAMVGQYFGGELPAADKTEEIDNDLINICENMYSEMAECMDKLQVPEALGAIWKIVQRANKYIDETAPWVLAKDEANKPRLATVMSNLIEAIRFVGVALQPFLTKTPSQIFDKIGILDRDDLKTFDSIAKFGQMPVGSHIEKGESIFQRYKINDEIDFMNSVIEKQMKEAAEAKKASEKAENVVTFDEISIDDFAKIELKVGKVVSSEKVAKADKLLCSQIDLGEGKLRTIVSGIAKWYTPEEMVGKSVVVVANLKPCKLRGIMSEGMLLCASDADGNLALISPEKPMATGSEVR